jgi:hypothetical protein
MAGQPGADVWSLVGAVVVADQVHVQFGRHRLVDRDQELLELGGAVLAVQLADHDAVGDVERGEQTGDAVAGVVVGTPLGQARHHRQHGLGPVQGLDLGLFVHAQHDGPFGRGDHQRWPGRRVGGFLSYLCAKPWVCLAAAIRKRHGWCIAMPASGCG